MQSGQMKTRSKIKTSTQGQLRKKSQRKRVF